MLRLEGVEIVQGAFRLAADLSVAPGITAVIGPSGAGKSTLLSLVGGFLLPERGRVLWDGRDITALAPGDRPVSTVFQDQNLFPHLDVFRNVGLGLSPGLKLSEGDRARIAEVLARVGLEGMDRRKPGELSGGQQSRVALARVLVRDRPVVLLDEPFAALGPSLKAEMLDLVSDTLAGATLLMVTHDPADALRVAERSIVVEGGRAAEPVETRALLDDPPPALRAYLGAQHPARDRP